MVKDDCIFCQIANGELETEFVVETDNVVAFNDNAPQTPTHVLVVPRKHYVGLRHIDDPALDAELIAVVRQVAEKTGLFESGFRVVTNDGADARQSVWHVHLHVLGDAKMSGKMA